jgi:hypothetical protein
MFRTHSPTIIGYPNCAKCGTPTRVVGIEPGEPGYDKRRSSALSASTAKSPSSNTNKNPIGEAG